MTDNHLNTSHLTHEFPSETYVCSRCEVTFASMENLLQHKQLHHASKEFVCSLCQEVFSELEELKRHDLRHRLVKANETLCCSCCDTTFTSLENLLQHKQLHNKNKEFLCLLCHEVFSEFKELKLHDLHHSLEEANEVLSGYDLSSLLPEYRLCPTCGKKIFCDEELFEHCLIHPELKNTYKNEDENKSKLLDEDSKYDLSESSDKDENIESYLIMHQEVIKAKSGNMYAHFTLTDHDKCHIEEFCRIFPTKPVAKMKYKNKNKKPNTSNCKKPKNIKSNLKNIVKKPLKEVITLSSDNEPDIIFEQNDSEISVNQARRSKIRALKKKLWSHTPSIVLPKALKICHICKKEFASTYKLERHMTTHQKLEYKCEKCDKKYRSEILLKRHVTMTHGEGEPKLYPCDLCTLSFFSKDSLKSHSYEHLDAGKIICVNCGRFFKNKSNLKQHICVKKLQRPCKICNNMYSNISHLRRHLYGVHKLNKEKVDLLLSSEKTSKKKSKLDSTLPAVATCRICNNKFSNINNLRLHLLNVHEVEESRIHDLIISFSTPSKERICGICKNKLSGHHNLRRHLLNVHKVNKKQINDIIYSFSLNSNNTKKYSTSNVQNSDDYVENSPRTNKGDIADYSVAISSNQTNFCEQADPILHELTEENQNSKSIMSNNDISLSEDNEKENVKIVISPSLDTNYTVTDPFESVSKDVMISSVSTTLGKEIDVSKTVENPEITSVETANGSFKKTSLKKTGKLSNTKTAKKSVPVIKTNLRSQKRPKRIIHTTSKPNYGKAKKLSSNKVVKVKPKKLIASKTGTVKKNATNKNIAKPSKTLLKKAVLTSLNKSLTSKCKKTSGFNVKSKFTSAKLRVMGINKKDETKKVVK